ncbi:MAG: hypothetical protein ACKPBA_05065, partial [Planctomycetota bacterium]
MIRPRRFWRPNGGADVPALMAGGVFLGAVAWVCGSYSAHWAGLFPGAVAVVPAVMLSAPSWSAEGRRLAWFFAWSLAAPFSRRTAALCEVIGSEAERERMRDAEGYETELGPKARYVARLWTGDGRCFDVELPMKRWATLRVGVNVRVAWKGGWVL